VRVACLHLASAAAWPALTPTPIQIHRATATSKHSARPAASGSALPAPRACSSGAAPASAKSSAMPMRRARRRGAARPDQKGSSGVGCFAPCSGRGGGVVCGRRSPRRAAEHANQPHESHVRRQREHEAEGLVARKWRAGAARERRRLGQHAGERHSPATRPSRARQCSTLARTDAGRGPQAFSPRPHPRPRDAPLAAPRERVGQRRRGPRDV